ncbi:MAG: succinate dehydrogenase, cytochrome b556 subunit [Proteobacteria bacterium]|nr:succinate dehydrogenase, cytochrome b556 subunit [Pseudomonadota bacterium]
MPNSDRPLSPHLQVYKPQLTSMLSILHRMTGAALGLGAILVTAWLLAALSGDAAFAVVQKFRASPIGQLMLFGWLLAFNYHLLNGVRHLKWDAGFGLDLKSVYRTGWVVVAGSVFLSALIWIALSVKS